MKGKLLLAGIVASFAIGFILTQTNASADDAIAAQTNAVTQQVDAIDYDMVKSCSFKSDCSHGTCKSGKCGGCSFKSDCNGWGVCKDGWCGACSFASDCKGFGSCSSGKCTKSPY